MGDFEKAYLATMKIEGGYANNSKDKGGETWKGIARNANPGWAGWKIIDEAKKQTGFPESLNKMNGLQVLVLQKYKEDYWDEAKLDNVNDQKVCEEMFDTGVNQGVGRAKLYFQRVLNVVNTNSAGKKFFVDLNVDGNIGPATVSAFNGLPGQQKTMVWKLLNCLQGAKYIDICEANPSQEIFMTSWASRVFEGVN